MSVPRIRSERVQPPVPARRPSRLGPSPGPPAPLNDTPLPEGARLILGALVVLVSLSWVVKDSVLAVIVAVVGWYVVTKLHRWEGKVSHCLESARADIIPGLREFEDWARHVLAYWQGRAVLDGLPEKNARRLLAQALRGQPERWLSALGDHGWLFPDLAAYFAGLRQRTKGSTAGVQAWLETGPGDPGADPGTDPQQVAEQLVSLITAGQDIRTYVLERYVTDLGRQPPLNTDAARRLLALAEEGKTSSAPSSARS